MLKANYIPYKFIFNFPGGTSRGVLTEKLSFFIKIWDTNTPAIFGIGEVSLIPKLSIETPEQVEIVLNNFIKNPEYNIIDKLSEYPAIKFGIETAFLDLKNGGNRILYPSKFTRNESGIKINGLVWMGDKELMLKRVKEKIDSGFSCVKIKIGAINFEDELDLLKFIRKTYSEKDLEIRVDANGAFSYDTALAKMNKLTKYNIHSIEQPIKQGQWKKMAELCKKTVLPIVLDEELIGVHDTNKRIDMLNTIKPQYIILKPSLIGGLNDAHIWSSLAKDRNIDWWITSALESNIGLNYIAQWTYIYGTNMPQGLGTGQVFSNNIKSPLNIKGEELMYDTRVKWDLKTFLF
jgi:o-succinylbenzoate synthase